MLSCRGWRLRPGETVALTGNIQELGSWQSTASLAMSEIEGSCWQAEVSA